MFERMDTVLDKLRFVFVGILMVASVLLLPLIISSTGSAENPAGTTSLQNDDTNAVASGFNAAASHANAALDNSGRTAANIGSAIGGGVAAAGRGVGSAAVAAGSAAASGTMFVVHGIGSGITLVARGISSVVVFGFNTTASTLGLISKAPVVSAVIEPDARADVPVIDQQSAELYATKNAVSTVALINQTNAAADDTPAWPIHGQITTYFGVPHWPYQPTHTGIDISDGKRSGITPVMPFRPGRVIETTRSAVGLGNHVVVDHGDGVTSVYAHLFSISVQEGAVVNKTSVLGYEGSTGASTGTHLHFEILINGVYVNPLNYVSGRP